MSNRNKICVLLLINIYQGVLKSILYANSKILTGFTWEHYFLYNWWHETFSLFRVNWTQLWCYFDNVRRYMHFNNRKYKQIKMPNLASTSNINRRYKAGAGEQWLLYSIMVRGYVRRVKGWTSKVIPILTRLH